MENDRFELVETRGRYLKVLESQRDLICRFDQDGKTSFANEACGRFFGRPSNDLLGKPCPFVFQADPPLYSQILRDVSRETPLKSVRIRLSRIDGDVRSLDAGILGIYRPDGELEEYQLSARDVTERALAEERLRLAHAELESLFSSIGSVMFWLDGEDRVRKWNSSAEQVFGVVAAKTVGRPAREILHWDWTVAEEAMGRCRNLMTPVRLDEVWFVRADGARRILGMTLNPAPSESGAPGVLVLAMDITEIKKQEARRSHDMKMQSIGRLAAGIAHEINTPVQYVSYNEGFLRGAFDDVLALVRRYRELLEEACGVIARTDAPLAASVAERADAAESEADLKYLAEEAPKTVENSLKGLGQVARIVSAMREFSHPGQSDETAFDVNSALSNTVLISRNEWKRLAEVKLELAEDLPLIYGHPQDLNQVFLNLIVNAAQAIEEKNGFEGGFGEIRIRSGMRDGKIEVCVSDTGPGVPEDIRSRIFEPFFTTKPVGKGTGQGLAIAHALVVERYGGEILLEDRSGGGSIFTVLLPVRGPGRGAPAAETKGLS